MSQEYDNKGTGVIFFEDDKKSDKHPDFKGSMTDLDGKEFWVSGWKKVSKNGKKLISLKIESKDSQKKEQKSGW